MNDRLQTRPKVQISNWVDPDNYEWVINHKANTRKTEGAILNEAIRELRRKYPESRKLNF